jgi:hypothetical protein
LFVAEGLSWFRIKIETVYPGLDPGPVSATAAFSKVVK